MWQYLWAHATFHLVRWFPPSNRVKIVVLTMLFTLALSVPQLYVLMLDKTTRWCSQPLMGLLISSIVCTFFVMGFTFLFMTMVPCPREVKIAFHVFGLATFIIGLAEIIATSKADDCSYSTPELYKISVALAVVSGLAIGFVVFLLPFWLINEIKRNCILDRPARTGLCYEPVKCCSCLWHI